MNTPSYITEFREKFPTKIAEVIDDFGSTVKSDLEQFITSQIEAAEERGRNQGIQEAQQDYFEAGRQSGRDQAVDYIKEQKLHYAEVSSQEIQRGNVMLAYDFDSRQVAAMHLIKGLESARKTQV